MKQLMAQGGPTDQSESYFKKASDQMIRSRTLCAKANDITSFDSSYVSYLEELFGRKLDGVRILTPFICDFGNRITFGKNVTICPSVTIGKYAVVGAGAVVTKDVYDYAVVAGTPAKIIKYLNPNDQKE